MNHGRVKTEVADYQEPGRRAVVCELQDGWHVVECYINSGQGLRCVERKVIENLADARTWAKAWL